MAAHHHVKQGHPFRHCCPARWAEPSLRGGGLRWLQRADGPVVVVHQGHGVPDELHAGGEKMQLEPSKNAMQKNAKNAKKMQKKCKESATFKEIPL